MKQTDVKVSFYLKKSEADSGGYCPVMAKLNIGRYSEAAFSVKMRVLNPCGRQDVQQEKALRQGK